VRFKKKIETLQTNQKTIKITNEEIFSPNKLKDFAEEIKADKKI